MSKYYIAPTRKGRMLKIVEDVRVPVSDKLQKLGRMQHDYIIKQRLVARFVNEDEAREWLEAYQKADTESDRRFNLGQKVRVWDHKDAIFDAIYIGYEVGEEFKHGAVRKGCNYITFWKHCEPYEW